MTISLNARTLFACSLAAMTLAFGLILGSPTQARAASAPAKCGYDVPYGQVIPPGSVQECWAPSTQYPNLQGWYALVGHPGECSWAPFMRYLEPNFQGALCFMSPRYDAYTLVNGGWQRSQVGTGTKGYVYPYTAEWRWVYINNGWVAMRAVDVGIYW